MRLVSLVPSLTETLFALGIEDSELIGRTSWCVHPADRVASVRKLGGTKTPNVQRIIELEPDLVVLEREENPKPVWEQLVAAGIETYVDRICDPQLAPSSRSHAAATMRRSSVARVFGAGDLAQRPSR